MARLAPVLVAACAATLAAVAGCSSNASSNPPPTPSVPPPASASISAAGTATAPDSGAQPSGPLGTLSAAEARDVTSVRTREQVGADAYRHFSTRFTLPVFANLSAAQQTLSATAAAMMARFGVSDPQRGAAPGHYADPTDQQAYDALIREGSDSAGHALEAMAGYEHRQQADLKAIRSRTSRPDLLRMYENLQTAAARHDQACANAMHHPGG